MRPKAPKITKLISVDPNTVDLSYKIDPFLHLFPPGLNQSVEIRSEYDPVNQWKSLPILYIDTKNDLQDVNHTISGLYPYTLYTLRIRMRSAAANQTDPNEYRKFWSPYVEQTIRTTAAKPKEPPLTSLGSFEVENYDIQRRSVFVYWRQIEDHFRNGPNFKYVITEVVEDGRQVPLVPNYVTKAYARFSNLRLTNYTFYVTSENDNGTASETASLFVPHYDQSKLLEYSQYKNDATQFAFSFLLKKS